MRSALVDELASLFSGPGAQLYLGEEVSIAEHQLQCAALASASGSSEAVVLAGLLHDIGHLLGDDAGVAHEALGASHLVGELPPEVVEPVRLHVAAKRYLCAVEGGYLAQLSAASVASLAEQGGAFTALEAEHFADLPHASGAVELRRYDEGAKVSGLEVPPFEHYRELLFSC